eukprot:snap_masked-scaffold_10-processed-gene-8.32-mRNA-1 protein AED:1.00 eAED:1.00 QI:0/0/0/0/1/1/2/0/90
MKKQLHEYVNMPDTLFSIFNQCVLSIESWEKMKEANYINLYSNKVLVNESKIIGKNVRVVSVEIRFSMCNRFPLSIYVEYKEKNDKEFNL